MTYPVVDDVLDDVRLQFSPVNAIDLHNLRGETLARSQAENIGVLVCWGRNLLLD